LIDLQNSFFNATESTKFPTKPRLVTHHTLSMLLHYLGKLKNKKFTLPMRTSHAR